MLWPELRALAKSDPARALAAARSNPSSWARCQDLALVARFAPGGIAETAFAQSVATAESGEDAYIRTALLAWPIRAAIERGRIDLAAKLVRKAMQQVPEVEPLPSRAHALDQLWAAVFPSLPRLREPVWQAVAAHCPPDTSWRVMRLYRRIAASLRSVSEAEADRVIAVLPPGKTRAALEKARARGERHPERQFF